MSARISPARVEDAEELADLHLDVWEEAYAGLMSASVFAERRGGRAARVESWRTIIGAGSSDNLLAWSDEWSDDGALVGFSSTGPGRDDAADDLPGLEVMALYVRAEVYGTGVGHALLTAAIGPAEAYLWVLDGNSRAIAFYERQGFVFDGVEKPEDVGLHRRMVRRA